MAALQRVSRTGGPLPRGGLNPLRPVQADKPLAPPVILRADQGRGRFHTLLPVTVMRHRDARV